jgi:plasmid stability protein
MRLNTLRFVGSQEFIVPTLIVESVPDDVFADLQQRANAGRRSNSEEAIRLLRQAVGQSGHATARLPDFIPGEEMTTPFDLPLSSQPVTVAATPAAECLPDALVTSTGE